MKIVNIGLYLVKIGCNQDSKHTILTSFKPQCILFIQLNDALLRITNERYVWGESFFETFSVTQGPGGLLLIQKLGLGRELGGYAKPTTPYDRRPRRKTTGASTARAGSGQRPRPRPDHLSSILGEAKCRFKRCFQVPYSSQSKTNNSSHHPSPGSADAAYKLKVHSSMKYVLTRDDLNNYNLHVIAIVILRHNLCPF